MATRSVRAASKERAGQHPATEGGTTSTSRRRTGTSRSGGHFLQASRHVTPVQTVVRAGSEIRRRGKWQGGGGGGGGWRLHPFSCDTLARRRDLRSHGTAFVAPAPLRGDVRTSRPLVTHSRSSLPGQGFGLTVDVSQHNPFIPASSSGTPRTPGFSSHEPPGHEQSHFRLQHRGHETT